MDDHCTYCQKRGVPCTKKLPSRTREQSIPLDQDTSLAIELRSAIYTTPASPDNERLNMTEWLYIQEFLGFPRPDRYVPLLLNSRPGSPVAIELYNAELNPHASTVYRSAVLVLMSHIKKNHPSDTLGYVVKYRQEAQKCINDGSFEEVVYASYVVTIYSIIGGNSVEMAINLCRQFCKSVVELTRKQKDDWIELLWRNLLASLYYVHRDTVLSNYSITTLALLMESVVQWEKLLDTSYCLLVSDADISDLPLSMTTEKICHKVTSLCVYMQLYLDQFLTRASVAEHAADEIELARDRLCSIADRIMRLVSHLSGISDYIHHAYQIELSSSYDNNPAKSKFLYFADVEPRALNPNGPPDSRDTALALLYAFARLLKNLLAPAVELDETSLSEPHRSAIAICRICATLPTDGFMDSLIVKRSLFWSGVVLTESTFPAGISFSDSLVLLTK